MPRALLLTGVAGVGKSTIADAIGRLLSTAGEATAVVDVDLLAQFGPPPRPKGDFYHQLKCANLKAVWSNFKAAGARFVVVTAGIDSPAERDDFARSLDGCDMQTVRLSADPATVRQRRRDRGDPAPKIDRPLTAQAGPGELSVVNDRPPSLVARQVLVRAGWTPPAGG